jgi:hypothetical protein
VTAALAALPSDPNAPPAPLSAAALLNTAAAVAAEQPGPEDWTGFRYVQQVERRTNARYTLEATDESWTSSDWQGLRVTKDARIVAGHLPTPDEQRADWEKIDAHRDGRWTPGGSWRPLESTVKYDVLRDVLLLLTEANATPAQRAALIAVLRNYEGVTPLEHAQDHRGRTGNGVDIPTGRATVRVLFSPTTSELLEWSEPGEVHTYLSFGHVLAPRQELDGQ